MKSKEIKACVRELVQLGTDYLENHPPEKPGKKNRFFYFSLKPKHTNQKKASCLVALEFQTITNERELLVFVKQITDRFHKNGELFSGIDQTMTAFSPAYQQAKQEAAAKFDFLAGSFSFLILKKIYVNAIVIAAAKELHNLKSAAASTGFRLTI